MPSWLGLSLWKAAALCDCFAGKASRTTHTPIYIRVPRGQRSFFVLGCYGYGKAQVVDNILIMLETCLDTNYPRYSLSPCIRNNQLHVVFFMAQSSPFYSYVCHFWCRRTLGSSGHRVSPALGSILQRALYSVNESGPSVISDCFRASPMYYNHLYQSHMQSLECRLPILCISCVALVFPGSLLLVLPSLHILPLSLRSPDF